jgi:hypothetical protein
LAGDDDGHSEREVGDEVDAGDYARPLMLRREGEDQPQGCGEGCTEADTGDGLPDDHGCQTSGVNATDDADGPDDGREDSDDH